MTNLIAAIILGVVQGLTEFLPVSSTGHLILFEHWLGVSERTFGLSFDVALHVGTALALILIFWKDIKQIVKESAKHFPSPLLLSLIIGTIPAGIAGLLLEKKVDHAFRTPQLVAWSLLLFSGLLTIGDYLGKKKKEINPKHISGGQAFIIGLFQAIAIIPGVSRSGSTITGGLIVGQDRTSASRFAFLLSIPIILLAGAKQGLHVVTSGMLFSPNQLLFFIVGFATAFIVAYFTVKWFLQFFQKYGFLPFVIYRVLIAVFILVLMK